MNKRNWTFILILIISVTGLAQTSLSLNEISQLQQNVKQVANKTNTIKSDFIQEKHLDMLDHVLISKGVLMYKAPDLIRWEYVSPKSNVVVFKEETLKVLDNGKSKEIDLSTNKLFRELNNLILGSIRGDMFDDSAFSISYFKENNSYIVRFDPKEHRLKKFMHDFQITFSATSYEVIQIKITEPNLDYTTIRFQNRINNELINSSEFRL